MLLFFTLLLAAGGFTKDVCRPCTEKVELLKKIPEKNLKSGIPVVIARGLTAGGKAVLNERFEISYDLWDDVYIIKTVDRIEKLENDSTFQAFLCKRLNLREEEISSAGQSEDIRYDVILNPIGKHLSKTLEKWAEKNAGTYSNWGMKINWDSGNQGGMLMFRKEIGLWKE